MSMKMVKAAMMVMVTGMFVVSVFAEVSVMDVKCTPRNPWNGLVDIEYTIATDNPDADVYVNPVAYDGDRRITLFPSSFTGDGATNAVKAGKHTMVWDAKKDFGTFSSANFQIKIYAGERLSRYVVIDLSGGNTAETYPVRLSHVGPDLSDDACRTTNLWLRLVPPGEFWMGSPEDEFGRFDNEDLHHVTFTKPFYLGIFPVTVGQYESVLGFCYKSVEFNNATNRLIRPVDSQYFYCDGNWGSNVNSIRGNWDPTAKSGFRTDSFIGGLRSRVRNVAFDLPSETRWEYACRAGTMTALPNGRNISDLTLSQHVAEIGAYYGNRSNGQSYDVASVDVGTTAVGSFNPNRLGLYDMIGNVWEICSDGGWGNDHLGFVDVVDPEPCSTFKDPQNTHTITRLSLDVWYIARGGTWRHLANECRSARRVVLGLNPYGPFGDANHTESFVGFRICAEADF